MCDEVASLEVIDVVQIKVVDHGFVTGVFVNLKNLVSDTAKQAEDFFRRCTISFAGLGLMPGSFAYSAEVGEHFKDDGWSLRGQDAFQAFHDLELGTLDVDLDG